MRFFLKEIGNMSSVFLSSCRNIRGGLEKLVKAVGSCSHSKSTANLCSAKLPFVFDRNTVQHKNKTKKHPQPFRILVITYLLTWIFFCYKEMLNSFLFCSKHQSNSCDILRNNLSEVTIEKLITIKSSKTIHYTEWQKTRFLNKIH